MSYENCRNVWCSSRLKNNFLTESRSVFFLLFVASLPKEIYFSFTCIFEKLVKCLEKGNVSFYRLCTYVLAYTIISLKGIVTERNEILSIFMKHIYSCSCISLEVSFYIETVI